MFEKALSRNPWRTKNLKNSILVILNPMAGGGATRRRWKTLSEELRKKIGPFDSQESTSMGHGRVLARDAANAGYDLIIACGGDGTIHEVANGIFDATIPSKPTLGILCIGTGADLIKTLGIPKNLTQQIEILMGNQTRMIDLGEVEYANEKGKKEKRIFINIADAGVGADVVRRVSHSRALFGRKLAYLTATLRSYAAWHSKPIKITTENGPMVHLCPKNPIAIVVANGRYFGGGMPIAPTADLADGFFDLVVIGDLNPITAAFTIPLLYTKQLKRLNQVYYDRVRSVMLESKEPVQLDMDGEPIGSLPAKFTILPKSLKIKSH